jgi:hypothetical protein
MATQRLTIATIAGDAAGVVSTLFQQWQTGRESDRAVVDHFCQQLRAHSAELPIVCFCEWIDHWLMGNLVPGVGAVEGKRFHAACMTPERALSLAEK